MGLMIGINLAISGTVTASDNGKGSEPTTATGYLEFADNPSIDDLLPALNGFSGLMFVSSNFTFPRIRRSGTSLAGTLSFLVMALELHKNDAGNEALAGATYQSDGSRLIITYDTPGTIGNSYTLGESTSNITLSGPALTGGSD